MIEKSPEKSRSFALTVRRNRTGAQARTNQRIGGDHRADCGEKPAFAVAMVRRLEPFRFRPNRNKAHAFCFAAFS
jgi:hypothetical protein